MVLLKKLVCETKKDAWRSGVDFFTSISADKIRLKIGKRAAVYSMTNSFHQVEIKGDVMEREEPETKDFVVFDEMTEVAPRESVAKRVRFTGRGEQFLTFFPLRILDVDRPVGGVGGAVPGDPGG